MILTCTILLGVSFLFYLHFLWSVWRGLKRLRRSGGAPQRQFASVIIAARNEQATIGRCLESLLQQGYPSDSYEIIVIDDHSTDRTLKLVRDVAAAAPPARISAIRLSQEIPANGKPEAIARGVKEAHGEIILCTDADCIAPPHWIESMVGCFEPSVAFVAGPVLENPRASIVSRLQSLEFLGLITTAAGLIGNGKPITCNGANIAFRKSAFNKVSGHGDHGTSCDDETLMQRILARNVGRVVFNSDPDAAVTTLTPKSWRAFWRQRTRWAAKRGRYENAAILFKLILLYSFFGIFLLTSILAPFEPGLWSIIVPVFLLKMIADAFILRKGARMLNQSVSLPYFLVAELLHVPYIALAGLIGQFTSIRWKGRKLEK